MPTLQWSPVYSVAVYVCLLAGCLLVLWLSVGPRRRSRPEFRAVGFAGDVLQPADSDALEPGSPQRNLLAAAAGGRGVPRRLLEEHGIESAGQPLGAGEGRPAAVQRGGALGAAERLPLRPAAFGGCKRRGTPRRRQRHAAAGRLAAAAGAVRRRPAGGRGDLLRRADDGNDRLSGGGRELSPQRHAPARLPRERPGRDGRRGDSGTRGSAIRFAGQPRPRPRADRRLRICRAAGGNPHPCGGQPLGPAVGFASGDALRRAGNLRSDNRARPGSRWRHGHRDSAAARRSGDRQQPGALSRRLAGQEASRDLHGSDAGQRVPLAARRTGRRSDDRVHSDGSRAPSTSQTSTSIASATRAADTRKRGKSCFTTTW